MSGEPWDGRYVVYRVYGTDGHLLYVGCTKRLRGRWLEHTSVRGSSARAIWAPLARRVSVKVFRDEDTALMAEARAIAEELPIFNRYRGYTRRSA